MKIKEPVVLGSLIGTLALSTFTLGLFLDLPEVEYEEVIIKSEAIPQTTSDPESEEIAIEEEEIEEVIEEIIEYDEDDIYLLAQLMHSEAGNQDDIGKRLVIDTVLNRVDSDRFPDNIYDVIHSANQYYINHSYEPTLDDLEIAKQEYQDRYNSEVLFFRTDYYHEFCTPCFQHQDHYFSK